jgi:glycosyltransferase involved in cell wall biosynthesis
MTTKHLRSVNPQNIYNLLPKEITEESSQYVIKELQPSSENEFCRKRSFRFSVRNGLDLLLTCSKDLQATFNNSKLFHESLPSLSCQPKFIVKGPEYDLIGYDYFDGKPLDQMFVQSKISDLQIREIIDNLKKDLLKIELASSTDAMQSEFNAFIEVFDSNENLSKTDLAIFKNEIIPYIQNFILNTNPRLRWSSGDLIARNILIDEQFDYRIIDYEFAHQTHFFEEDWIRLGSYGEESFLSLEFVKFTKENVPFPLHIYHLLRQTLLNRNVHKGIDYIHHLKFDLVKIIKESTERKIISSQALRGLSEEVTKYRESCTNYKMENISLEKTKEELQNLYIKQTEEKAELHSLNSTLVNENTILHQQITESKETQAILKCEKEILIEEKSDLIEEKNATDKQNLSLRNELEIRDDKIKRIQNSFSWKITALLRFLRRKVLDPFKSSLKDDFDPVVYLELNPDLQESFKGNLEEATKHFHLHGLKEKRAYSYQIAPPLHLRTYEEWIRRYDTKTSLSSAKLSKDRPMENPFFSIILPVFDPSVSFLESALQSVLDQSYENWELCIVDDASTNTDIKKTLSKFAKRDCRLKIKYREINGHISIASNDAIKMARGKFLVFFDHDDILPTESLSRVAEVLEQHTEVKIVYTDEDKIDKKGIRSDPYFKPDWNPELFLSQNYLCHLTCCDTKLTQEVGCFREGYEGSQDWDLFLRITEKLADSQIFHIPEILYHWRKTNSSTAKSVKTKDYVLDSAKRTLLDTIERRKIDGEVIPVSKKFNYWRIKRKLPTQQPMVSILIPTKDKVELLSTCVNSLINKTNYNNYEIIVLDNDSVNKNTFEFFEKFTKNKLCKVHKVPGSFNYSKINNEGVRVAKGEILVLLNNDIEIIDSCWLEEIVSHAIRPEIGCVGAKLFYSDDTIQHAGVILGLGGVAGHAYRGFNKNHSGSRLRLHLSQNFEAVTAACLAVKKTIFEEVNGLNEENLAVAFNDVDFCIKVRQARYRNLWTPNAILYHHESASRGSDEAPENKNRFQKEVKYMKETWSNVLQNDPTYNPNLTLDREDFSLSFPPRKSH